MDLKTTLKEVKCFLLDLDGTLYLDGEPIGDMINTLKTLRNKGIQLVYLTNNSSKSVNDYVTRLKKIGFYDEKDIVLTSATGTISFLNRFYKNVPVTLCGTDSVKREFIDNGVNLVENGEIAVLSYDTTLTYQKMCDFNKVLHSAKYYFATHPDVTCPAPECFVPDVGSWIELFKASAKRVPDDVIGKPNKLLGDVIKTDLNLSSNAFMMVGDRLNTDIAFGLNSAFHTLLVYSGETTPEMHEASSVKAEFTLDNFNDVLKFF